MLKIKMNWGRVHISSLTAPSWCKSCRNPFNPSADYKEIYQLGISAAAIGKTHEAVIFLKIYRAEGTAHGYGVC